MPGGKLAPRGNGRERSWRMLPVAKETNCRALLLGNPFAPESRRLSTKHGNVLAPIRRAREEAGGSQRGGGRRSRSSSRLVPFHWSESHGERTGASIIDRTGTRPERGSVSRSRTPYTPDENDRWLVICTLPSPRWISRGEMDGCRDYSCRSMSAGSTSRGSGTEGRRKTVYVDGYSIMSLITRD